MKIDYSSPDIKTERFRNSSGKSLVRVVLTCSAPGCSATIKITKGQEGPYTGKCRRCATKKRPFQYLFMRLLATAKSHSIPVHLTYEQFLEFTKIPECHYCSSPIKWEPNGSGEHVYRQYRYFLDRKDNGVGYSEENCVVCCSSCNLTRGNRYSYEEFVSLGPALRLIHKNRLGNPPALRTLFKSAPRSKEFATKRQLREKLGRFVDDAGTEYSNVKEASLQLGVSCVSIRKVLRKEIPSAKGRTFTYLYNRDVP